MLDNKVKEQVKKFAEEFGLESDKADALADKCYAEIAAWKPYGGATSFAQIDQQKAVREYSYAVDDQTYQLRGLIENITDSDDFDVDQKAAAIQAVADEFKTRVNSLNVPTDVLGQMSDDEKTIWNKVKNILFGEKRTFTAAQRQAMAKSGQAMSDGSFPIANESDLKNAIQAVGRASNKASAMAHIKKRARSLGKTDLLPEGWKNIELPEVDGGFKIITDEDGNLRWLSVSSNAFEDREKELFTTAALEEAVEYADKSGERGPLMFYHIPGTEIGQCDYQAVVGRFLLESGTFDDTPLSQKAVEYFANSDEEHQVSIGYQYRIGDEEDGQYDWLRIKERSICPLGTAANQWTDFKVIGETPMDANKAEALEKIFGKELASGVIASAEAKTKELEASTKFKADPATETPKEDPKEEEEKTETPQAGLSTEQVQGLATLITGLTESVDTLQKTITGIQEEVKELKKSDDQKVADIMTPRASKVAEQVRPSESPNNSVSQKDLEEIIPETTDAPTNPARAYVEQLLRVPAVAN